MRVGIAYAVIGWILAQIAEFAFENFGAPEWVLKTVVVFLLLGLPLALFFAWAFEITPDGVKREEDVDRSQSITQNTGRRLDRAIIGLLVLALGYFIWERQAVDEQDDAVDQSSVAAIDENVTPGPKKRSIAVLPFVNMSSDEEQEWFSDGLTEELLNALARTPDLLVAARTSSFRYKGSSDDIQTIAAALGVAHVLEGSVRRDRDRLRVTAQLIRASDGFHLWSQTYDRNPEDVITIQEEVAIEIATALETAMDPEALAKMMSSGTDSVAAFNAYLQGLAYGADTLSTGDAYEFLGARDAFERAVELDPTFVLAYWELARFWEIQLRSANIVAGIVEMPRVEIQLLFDDAIEKAIEYQKNPVDKLRFRALQAAQRLRYLQALRLSTEYLEHRPNDQRAQDFQLSLLADLSMDERLIATIEEFQERDGFDTLVVQTSITFSLISDDKPFIREFAQQALRNIPDSAFLNYQAHRSLLWAGDIDGASQLVPIIMSSDMPQESRDLVSLRQACADNRLSNARRIYARLLKNHPEDTSIMWISHSIMGEEEKALETMMLLDVEEDLGSISDFLSYAYFDAKQFPNLMAMLESQGISPREPKEIPYRCKS